MATLAKIAMRSIRLHWRYSLGAGLSVVAGFLALCLFRAYMQDVGWMYQEIFERRSMYGHILVETAVSEAERRADPWGSLLDETDQRFLNDFLEKGLFAVKNWVPFLISTGTISNNDNQTIFYAKGYDLEAGVRARGKRWEFDTSVGTPLHKSEHSRKMVIGKALARSLGCDFGRVGNVFLDIDKPYQQRPFQCKEASAQLSATTEFGQSNAVEAQIVGVVDGLFGEVDDKYVMMALPLMQELYDTKGITFLAIELADASQISSFIEQLESQARAKGLSIQAKRWQAHPEGELYQRTMGFLSIFRNFVVAIMIGITGLSVFNAFLKLVNERTREIGTLRSIGFTASKIKTLFAFEAAFLGLIGVISATGLSLLITLVTNKISLLYKAGMLSEPVPFRMAYDLGIYASSAIFLMVVAISGAILATRSTVKQKITENLIHA